MRKKASLSLSVNAIVVLILAIVMLGLGLGFMRGMFGKVSVQIEEQISAEQEPEKPSSGNTVTLSREMIMTNAGEQEVVKVSIYNPTAAEFKNVKPTIDCSGGTIDPVPAANQQASTRNIAPRTSETFNLLLDIISTGPDTFLCEINFGTDADTAPYKKDITIKIVQ